MKRALDLCDAALERPAAERDAFLDEACAGDAELRAAAASVLAAVEEADAFLEVPAPSQSPAAPSGDATREVAAGTRLGRYTLLERLGEGGMGTVYLAEREGPDFTQRVALKIVREGLPARGLIGRFLAERRILASLNHPYIARLLDAGTTEAGTPWLVLEYVDGLPIDVYCDRNRLGVEARIELVRKVALAVQAAHQNLVVHRDLKPSNVLVTADGIPKLLDFGIAKPLRPDGGDPSGSTTVFGARALTPDYASPEQILDGRATTVSDVYSLGVLTYELLVGERPYRVAGGSHRELVRSVESLTVPRPSTRIQTAPTHRDIEEIAGRRATTPARLARALAGDLDTILLKALHRDPQRRYATATAFADDLERWAAGLPVEARGDSLGYRATRFVRRHRWAVATAAAFVVVLLGALALTGQAYLRADAARAEADRRFDQVRSIARALMFDVYDDIQRVPGTASARQKLAATAQEYLETLSESPGASPAVRFETAEGYARLAGILDRQTVGAAADRDAAQAAYARAEELFESLASAHPEPAKVRRALGRMRANRGRAILYTTNDVQAAREMLQRGLDALREAEHLSPDDAGIAAERLDVETRIADTYKWQNDYVAAVERLDAVLRESAERLAAAPGHPGLLKARADAAQIRGETRSFDGDDAGAVEDYAVAIEAYRRLLEVAGPDYQVDAAMVITNWSRGNALASLGRPEEALASLDAALAKIDLQLARDPDDVSTQRRRVIVDSSRADPLLALGRGDEAVRLLLEANGWFEKQAGVDDTPGSHRSVAVSYQITGDTFAAAGRRPEACVWWRRTLDKWRSIDATWGLSDFDAEEPEKLATLLAGC